ncbi:alpha/beta-Hydrolases superfamily protein [Striga asiatica]|uniref:Alpha/beta-Hydrolases superfamily protein n=1 Tax=Striga asiatica TaxID=4170 RepID=A0A5A7QNW1_STRAF|nr:alpha/beta-Hydrolases superfamily protein [Striga asiatica]
MAKSLRSKREKRLRAARRELVEPIYDKKEAAKLAAQEAALAAPKLPVRPPPSKNMDIASASLFGSEGLDVEMADGNESSKFLKPIGKKLKKKIKLAKRKHHGKGKIRKKHNITARTVEQRYWRDSTAGATVLAPQNIHRHATFSQLTLSLMYKAGKGGKMEMVEGAVVNGAVCSTETGNGGEDVYSSKDSDAFTADHLVVMVHGILGSALDWKYGAEKFVQRHPDKVYVHCSERNASKLTLDGVDVMGERLAEEVLELIKRKPSLKKISFIAHSVGGVVARYAIGKLYRPSNKEIGQEGLPDVCTDESKGTIANLEPVNFITVATPHLGSRGNKQVPFLFGVTAFEKVAGCVIHWIFRRTGRHLFLTDDDEGKPPLLKRMVEDNEECCFMSALRSFKRRVAYSNWEDCVDEKYPHIVYEERCKAYDKDQHEESTVVDNVPDELEEELVNGLSRVSWEKVDVSFHSSRLKFAAHSVIQVKDHNVHSDGADVIQHMIDHFLL